MREACYDSEYYPLPLCATAEATPNPRRRRPGRVRWGQPPPRRRGLPGAASLQTQAQEFWQRVSRGDGPANWRGGLRLEYQRQFCLLDLDDSV
jgi:hypothetical protein